MALRLYRIATYLLLVAAGLIALPILMLLPAAFTNPLLLISLAIGSSLVVYTYSSYRFLKMGVDEYFYCKPSMRKIIRISSYASLGVALLSVIEAIMMIAQPAKLKTQIEETLKSLPADATVNEQFYTSFIMSTPWIMLGYYAILVPHIIYTYRLLKQYRQVFDPPPSQPEEQD